MSSLWEYANPLKFMRTTDRLLPIVAVAAVVVTRSGCLGVLLHAR